MNSVNKTLYIPLYGKAYVSRKGLFLEDKKAEEIWNAEGFTLRGKAKSKWLAYYMGIRAAVFDRWTKAQLAGARDAVVLHIGCGLDSRALRVGTDGCAWIDVDFPDVIAERKRYFEESDIYRMLAADVREGRWLEAIDQKNAIVVMEGVSMYMTREELEELLQRLCVHFDQVSILMDCYTGMAAKLSRYKNPINDVGVTQVYGLDDPASLQSGALAFVGEHDMTPKRLVDELSGLEKAVFARVFAGGFSKKLYRLFEYRKA